MRRARASWKRLARVGAARRDGASLSAKARDLLRDALETYEDIGLAEIGEERERTFDRAHALSHEAVWRARPSTKR